MQPDPIAQLVVSLIADPQVVSLIQLCPHTSVEIDKEIFSTVCQSVILLLLIQEGLLSVIS